MAQNPVIEFECWRDSRGYRLVENKLWVVRNGGKLRPVPFDQSGELFRVFASTVKTPEDVLQFVQRHGGPLTTGGLDHPGEDVREAMFYANAMRDLMSYFATDRVRPRVEWVEHEMAPPATCHAAIVWDPEMKRPRWQFRTASLLDALWLQFG